MAEGLLFPDTGPRTFKPCSNFFIHPGDIPLKGDSSCGAPGNFSTKMSTSPKSVCQIRGDIPDINVINII